MPINPNPVERDTQSRNKTNNRPKEFTLSEPKYTFDDIVLSENVREQITDVLALYKYQKKVFCDWGLGSVIKQSGRISVNFYGESGTGKTMCSHALANELNKKLLIVNYSEIESKYVGETSKNLVSLFKFADEYNAIILFDEADALLSKRVTDMHSATDVSVNQTRNVLLKLLDAYTGIIIFTTNFISNFDPAFFRRILIHIKFDLPDKEARYRIWKHYLVPQLPIEEDKNNLLEQLSDIEEISGADISNCVLNAALHAASQQKSKITYNDFNDKIISILQSKESIYGNNLEIGTKKITKDYAAEKLRGGTFING